MKALAVFPARHKVAFVDQPQPRLEHPNDVLLRVREVGLCGTDKEISSFEYGAPPDGSDHLVLGHESLAEVVEVGRGVHHLKPGDLVVALVRRPCSHDRCLPCRAGRSDFCITGDYTERGIKRADGFLTEYVIDEEQFLVPVPKPLADVAVLIEPLTVISKASGQAHAILDRLPYETGPQRGLVLGAGAVGLLGAMVSVAYGMETVVYSREPESSDRADLVRSLGASYISADAQPLPSISDRAGEFDLVLEAVGVASVMMAATSALHANGVAILTGVPAEGGSTEVSAGRMLRNMVLKNQAVFGTVNAGRRDYISAIHQLEQFMTLFPESVRRLITCRLPLGQALETLSRGDGIKNVVQMSLEAA